MHIEEAAGIIQAYIFEKTGNLVNIQLPILPKYESKFITALSVAMNHFKIQFHV